jgi:anaerobic magnesium-protoporphyrin IX monomethyl ester cyclase
MGGVAVASPELFVRLAGPVDLVLCGDTERPLQELVRRLETGAGIREIDGTVSLDEKGQLVSRPGKAYENLDEIPFPRHSEFLARPYTFLYPVHTRGPVRFSVVLTSRGCPSRCAHCSPIVRVSCGHEYRFRSPANVVEELRQLRAAGVNAVYFCDDNFTADRKRTLALCDALRAAGTGIRWAAQGRADGLDGEVLRAMKEAGCDCINIGLESASTRVQRILNKKISLSHVRNVVRQAKRLGMNIQADFMVGVPGEKRWDVMKTLCFARKMEFELVTVLLFVPYPGSALACSGGNGTWGKDESIYRAGAGRPGDGGGERLRKEFYRKYYLRFSYIRMFMKRLTPHAALPLGTLGLQFLRYLLSK